MLADSEPKEECYHSLNWVMAGKAKSKGGGSEMGKQPHVRMESARSTTSMQNAPHLPRGTKTDYGGMALCPLKLLNKQY